MDLKEFVYEDQQRTFAELRSRGWIDVEHPDRSKLLSLIARSSESPNKIQTAVREKELAALSAWISAASTDPALIAAPVPKRNDLAIDDEVPTWPSSNNHLPKSAVAPRTVRFLCSIAKFDWLS